MTTYDLFLCWIIAMLLVTVVGEASIIKLGDVHGGAVIGYPLTAPPPAFRTRGVR
jgi:hypothetical protein